jgi:hypothetical protein
MLANCHCLAEMYVSVLHLLFCAVTLFLCHFKSLCTQYQIFPVTCFKLYQIIYSRASVHNEVICFLKVYQILYWRSGVKNTKYFKWLLIQTASLSIPWNEVTNQTWKYPVNHWNSGLITLFHLPRLIQLNITTNLIEDIAKLTHFLIDSRVIFM